MFRITGKDGELVQFHPHEKDAMEIAQRYAASMQQDALVTPMVTNKKGVLEADDANAVEVPAAKFHEGGLVTEPTMILGGERGPEKVAPVKDDSPSDEYGEDPALD